MVDLADEVEQHQVNMHAYADDTQLYLHCRRDDTTAAVTTIGDLLKPCQPLDGRQSTQVEH